MSLLRPDDRTLPIAAAPSVMREMNQRLLLDRLFTAGPATRPQLASDTGLSLPTVIAGLGGLEQAGLVRPAGRAESSHGRPAATYEADPTCGAVIGVDVGRAWVRVLVTDLAATRLAHLDVPNTARSARALVVLTGNAVTEATAKADLRPSSVTHTVIGSPGVYDTKKGRIRYASNLPGWQRHGLAESLMERLGPSLTIDNDANLAALGEHRYGAGRQVRDFVYLTIGTGVGLGLILDGRLYRGAHGTAGEAGYLPLGSALSALRHGQPPRGMLEESLAADAVVRYAVEAGMTEPLTAAEVFAAARDGEAPALRAVEAEARRLAELVATVLAIFDPELIVCGGGVGQNLDLLQPEMEAALAGLTPMRATMAVGSLGREAVVLGAIATGITIARDVVFKERVERTG